MKCISCHYHHEKARIVSLDRLFTDIPRLPEAVFASVCFLSLQVAIGQSATEVSSGVVERGEDFAIYQRVTALSGPDGKVNYQTNRFTLLENCLHYLDDGQWKESEDLIEVTPSGAAARRGPNKAAFSSDLNAATVFDIEISDGQRLGGGVRAIQLTDVGSGQSVVLAKVKQSAPGELLPPNRIVYRDAFEGLEADLMLVWNHNSFSQDLVLRQRPALPAAMNPATAFLEVVTELVESPRPTIREQTLDLDGTSQIEDHVVIHFGKMAMIMGKAFPVTSDKTWVMGALNQSEGTLPVHKQWYSLEDGRTYVVESVRWSEAEKQFDRLPAIQQGKAEMDSG